MEILTNNFNSDLNKLFVADAEANQSFYMFVSTIGNFNPVDSAVSQNEFLENTLFGKKIKNEDINFMIKYYPWQRGQSYSQYDDTLDLDGLKFYAVVGPNDNDTGDYRVYKCLDNNRGATAESPPTYDAANVNQIYETADGYVWKYMYRLTTLQFEAYNALGYIPIDPTANTAPTEVVGGGMSDIQVENALDNNGYFEKTAFTTGIDVSTSTLTIQPVELNWGKEDDYYVGHYAYITNNVDNVSNLFRVKSYYYNETTTRVDLVLSPEVSNPTIGTVEGATQANPIVITSTAHGLSTVKNQPVRFKNVLGMTELNDANNDGTPVYYAKVLTDDTFELYSNAAATVSVDGTGFGAYDTSTGTFNGDRDLQVSDVKASSNIRLFPRIDIIGDGIGAVAIPEISSGKVNSVTILNRGTGYRNAIATLVDPANGFAPEDQLTQDVRATLRPIIEPAGGHAYNLFDEFKCKHFSMYAYITAEDNTKIGDVNTYGAIGIVRQPTFIDVGDGLWRSGQANTAPIPDVFDNRIAIVTDEYAKLTANSTITQVDGSNEVTFVAKVHEIDSAANTVYLAEYLGPYVNNRVDGNKDTSFNPNLTIRTDGGQRITINNPIADNVVYSDYIQRTGEVYFMEDFFPLARTDLSREEFKFVLEF